MDRGGDCAHCKSTKYHWIVPFKMGNLYYPLNFTWMKTVFTFFLKVILLLSKMQSKLAIQNEEKHCHSQKRRNDNTI